MRVCTFFLVVGFKILSISIGSFKLHVRTYARTAVVKLHKRDFFVVSLLSKFCLSFSVCLFGDRSSSGGGDSSQLQKKVVPKIDGKMYEWAQLLSVSFNKILFDDLRDIFWPHLTFFYFFYFKKYPDFLLLLFLLLHLRETLTTKSLHACCCWNCLVGASSSSSLSTHISRHSTTTTTSLPFSQSVSQAAALLRLTSLFNFKQAASLTCLATSSQPIST